MNLQVNDHERELLVKLIDREVTDLSAEIRHTNTHDYRADLNTYRDQLRSLSERLVSCDQGATS
ncbi:MAG TPA: hypothetical protein PKN33_02900 [Phycisphaerae bacterium]|nr:hypothetical protein [Phycisphaerales bacterium]HNO76983.1 hypothetical protein [Phycisphaerae bacterium]